MTEKMILEIETKKPFNAYKNGFVIVRDDSKGKFVATEREDFFEPINKKIEKLTEDYETLKKLFISTKEEMKNENEEFKKLMLKRINDFLITYQNTNGKMIEMIKAFSENKN